MRTRQDPGIQERGSHASAVREANERAILTALRRLGEASKADLARQINLTQNTVGQIVATLAERGLVRETRKRLGLRGQPATLLSLDPNGAFAIGIELGRRSQQSVLLDFSGTVLKSRYREMVYPMPETAVALLRDDVAVLTRSLPPAAAKRLVGVGLATPYNLGSWRRELDIPAPVCAAWNDFDIRAELAAGLDLPIFVENDGTAAAAAELFNGHGRILEDFALVYIGAAVGGGLVLGGNYRSGATGSAADIGLMPVPSSSLASAVAPMGATDILLNRASAGSLIRHLRAAHVPVDFVSHLEEAMTLRQDLVDEWLADCADALLVPLFTISSLLDLQAIVIDGALPRALLKRLIETLSPLMERHAPEARQPPKLILGTMGRDAAALGAATLPFYFNYASDRDLLRQHQTSGRGPNPKHWGEIGSAGPD